MRESLGEQLRRAIERSGMTQEQLAELAGLTQAQISRFRHGKRDILLETADKLLRALRVKLTVREEERP